MRFLKILALLVIAFYLLVNITSYDHRFMKLAHVYRNVAGDFQTLDFFYFGRGNYAQVVEKFEMYKLKQNKPDEILYRTAEPNWSFWDSHLEYLLHPRWRLPYISLDAPKIEND